MHDWLILGAAMLATGCVAGTLAGLFGIGGGIVIVPVLETVLGILDVDPSIRMHVAVATSLATIIPTSISSARAHHRHHAVDVDIVKRWALWVLIGAVIGAWVASRLHSNVLAIIFATLAVLGKEVNQLGIYCRREQLQCRWQSDAMLNAVRLIGEFRSAKIQGFGPLRKTYQHIEFRQAAGRRLNVAEHIDQLVEQALVYVLLTIECALARA